MADSSVPPPPPSEPLVAGVPSAAATSETTEAAARGHGLVEWVTLRSALARAHRAAPGASVEQRDHYRRARLAAEVGARLLDPVDPFEAGSAAPHALVAFRESFFWALRLVASSKGLTLDGAGPAASALFGTLVTDVSDSLPPRSAARITSILERSFIDDAAEPDTTLHSDAELLREACDGLLARNEMPQRTIEQLHHQRRLRLGLVALVVVAFTLLAWRVLHAALQKPNIAQGKPWKASSAYPNFDPVKHAVDAATETKIFFHTNEDASPWVEIDLGAPTAFSSLTVVNRSDFGAGRAVPLVVEVGNDPAHLTEVAKRTSVFTTWKPSFPTQNARYVRLRVTRKTWFHLEQFSVHR